MGMMDVALNIRRLRAGKGMTLDTLAKRTHVTKGFLSQVENFRATPSLQLLFALAEALEVAPTELLATTEDDQHYVLTTAGKGEPIEREFPESGFVYRALAKGKHSKSMEPLLLEIPPRASRKSVTTNGDEFVYLLKGHIRFHLGKEVVRMRAGDSLYFDGEVPHFPENVNDTPATLLVVYSVTY